MNAIKIIMVYKLSLRTFCIASLILSLYCIQRINIVCLITISLKIIIFKYYMTCWFSISMSVNGIMVEYIAFCRFHLKFILAMC